ncbi:uncharacterized protein LOC126898118 [Daktulosphaira vitifoliae]|uniref:uncharacterized protein LOC126898118 n=1 Tax=Daktulosphaira vitifoliae TaxID=58002 RepID=UPI0021AA0593|nr:uncharacterized protein LOC126898118 [Daktulosphaira vitifoliae]
MNTLKDQLKDEHKKTSVDEPNVHDQQRRPVNSCGTSAGKRKKRTSKISNDVLKEVLNLPEPVYTSDSDEINDIGDYYMVDHGFLFAEQVRNIILGQKHSMASQNKFSIDEGFQAYCTDEETLVKTHVLDQVPEQCQKGSGKQISQQWKIDSNASEIASVVHNQETADWLSDDLTSLQRCKCNNTKCSVYLTLAVDFLNKAMQNEQQEAGEMNTKRSQKSSRRPCVYERIVKWLTYSAASTEDEVYGYRDEDVPIHEIPPFKANDCCVQLKFLKCDSSTENVSEECQPHSTTDQVESVITEKSDQPETPQPIENTQMTTKKTKKNPKCWFSKRSDKLKNIPIFIK